MLPTTAKMTASQRAGLLWEQGHKGSERSFTRAWKVKEGDIHTFKSLQDLNALDYSCLIESGAINKRAANHPVIILHCPQDSTHAVVSTISAYSSGDFNNNLPPWRQDVHRSKKRAEFRAFVGSERPDNKRPLLELEDGKRMPKEKVSNSQWVYAMNAFVVPITALGKYNKVKKMLRLTEESLLDLKSHMMTLGGDGTLGRAMDDVRLQYSISGGVISRREVKAEAKSKVQMVQVPLAKQPVPTKVPLGPKGWQQLNTAPKVVVAPQTQPWPAPKSPRRSHCPWAPNNNRGPCVTP